MRCVVSVRKVASHDVDVDLNNKTLPPEYSTVHSLSSTLNKVSM